MDTIAEIKARLDIVDVIGEYVPLQKAGSYYRALCPFHTERTPSFYVSPQRQVWHCFGACNTGGDIFSFVMKKEGVDFREALRLLARRAGVPLLEERRPEEDARLRRLYQAHEAAIEFYHRVLTESPDASLARSYLERRGLHLQTARRFMLGYSPRTHDALAQHLKALGFTDQELIEGGLAVRENGGIRDRFYGRIMIPIWDEGGRPVGFGARALDESHPKYLNTPQTPIFDKGGLLYLLDRAKEAIRREGKAVVVEGYMDAIAAHWAGFTNVVATMGTSLTERHVRSLRRYARRVILALDPDAAGQEAVVRGHQTVMDTADQVLPVLTWRRSLQLQEVVGIDLLVALLPSGYDPDQLIRSSPAKWKEILEGAEPVLDFRFRKAQEGKDLNDPKAARQVVDELLPLIASVPDPVTRAHYLQRLSRLCHTPEGELAEMARRLRRQPLRGRQSAPEAARPKPRAEGERTEEMLLALILRYPELRPLALHLPENLFWQEANRAVFLAWRSTSDLAHLAQSLAPELQVHTDALIGLWTTFPKLWDNDYGKRAFHDLWRRLEERALRARKKALAAAFASQEGQSHLAEKAALVLQGQGAEDPQVRLLLEDLEVGRKLHAKRYE